MYSVGHFIDGQEVTEGVEQQNIYNPALGTVQASVDIATQKTVLKAINSAHKAFPFWRATPPIKRARIMFRFRELLVQHTDQICDLIGQEHGKICHDAAGELQRGIENVEYACGIPDLLKGEYTKNVGAKIDAWSEFHPLGVVAGITPFNFPVMVPLWMYPIAIACGNTFVLKPSERDPSSALFVAKLLQRAGLPKGVLNVVNGDKQAVDTLLHDNQVKAVSFVGSTPIARRIYSIACEQGKRCQALGGAKNHAIIMPDADIDNAVNQLLGAAFGSSGERCMALSVAVVVGDQTAEIFVNKMRVAMEGLQLGVYSDKNNNFGPLITKEHKAKVERYITSAQQEGATIVVDGRNTKVQGYEQGFFVGGTLIDHVTQAMDSYKNEIFGPVLQIMRVENMQDAIDIIDTHAYGNGTCIFTRDGEAARYFTDTIEVGMVGINVPLPVPVAYHSFGGWKQSLFGDLHAYGPDGVRFYTKRKTVTQRWPSAGVREGASFAMPTMHTV